MVAGMICGPAKNAQIHSLTILRPDNKGEYADALKAFNWIFSDYVDRDRYRPTALVNCSVIYTTGSGTGMQTAMQQLLNSRIAIVAAAGNGGTDVSGFVPGGYGPVITVGGSDADDSPASNVGSGVDLFAPSKDVQAAFWGGGYGTFYGTSFATPLVSGVAAQYLAVPGNEIATPATLSTWLTTNASVASPTSPTSYPANTTKKILWTNL